MSADSGATQRDILLKLDEKVDTLIIQMATMVANSVSFSQRSDDHEKRIRFLEQEMPEDAKERLTALERFRYGWPSIAVLGLIISAILAAYYIHAG
jgi:hypothetical protein